MPPKTTFTRLDIIQAAFDLISENGLKNLTVRSVAQKLGSSTAPIYSSFTSVEELQKEALVKAMNLMLEYARQRYTNLDFLNMGVGICYFAREHPMLYRVLLLDRIEHQEVLAEFNRELNHDLSIDPYMGQLSDELRKELLWKMELVTHGLASLICVGILKDITDEKIVIALHEIGTAVIYEALNPTQKPVMTSDGKGGFHFES